MRIAVGNAGQEVSESRSLRSVLVCKIANLIALSMLYERRKSHSKPRLVGSFELFMTDYWYQQSQSAK